MVTYNFNICSILRQRTATYGAVHCRISCCWKLRITLAVRALEGAAVSCRWLAVYLGLSNDRSWDNYRPLHCCQTHGMLAHFYGASV